MLVDLGRAAQGDARGEGLALLVVEEQAGLAVAQRLDHRAGDALEHAVEGERGPQVVAQTHQRFHGRGARRELGGKLRLTLVEARVVDHEGGKAGDRLPHPDALLVEVGRCARFVEHGDAQQLALHHEGQDEDLASVELLEHGHVDALGRGRQHQRFTQVADLFPGQDPRFQVAVGLRGDECRADRGREAHTAAFGQKDRAARHAQRRR